jgi:hypothetical protein
MSELFGRFVVSTVKNTNIHIYIDHIFLFTSRGPQNKEVPEPLQRKTFR